MVTFNRKVLLLECLGGLTSQTYPLAAICIVDNASTDGTPQALREAGFVNLRDGFEHDAERHTGSYRIASEKGTVEIHYIRNAQNSGGAGGFWAAMRFARRFGYDGYWLMDDDAFPEPQSLHELVRFWDCRAVSALACTVSTRAQIALMHRGYFDFCFDRVYPTAHRAAPESLYFSGVQEIDMASFVGLLVKDDAVRDVGLPRRSFFIQHDDTEYCIRLRERGRILLVPGSRIEHREAVYSIPHVGRYLFLSSPRPPLSRLPGLFFSLRNLTWIGKRYHRHSLTFAWACFASWARASISIIFFDRGERLVRLRLIATAYSDGLRGRFNNRKPWSYRSPKP